MKLCRTVFSLLLVCCLLCSAAAQAEEPVAITAAASQESGTALEVAISRNSGLAAWLLELTWDPEKLSVRDVAYGETFSQGTFVCNTAQPGTLVMVWYNPSAVAEDGKLFSVEFSPQPGASRQVPVRLRCSPADMVNQAGQQIPVELTPEVYVTVSGGGAPAPLGGSTPSPGSGGGGKSPAPSGKDTPPPASEVFCDVKDTDFFCKAVEWALERGITNGMEPDRFGPERQCTRAEALTFLWRAENRPEPTVVTRQFEDVDLSAYFAKAVMWAVDQNITQGTSPTTFAPQSTVTRGQMVTLLWRVAGQPDTPGELPFRDVNTSDYYAQAVLWASANGITQGTSEDTFSPPAPCTRGEIVTFLLRFYQSQQ